MLTIFSFFSGVEKNKELVNLHVKQSGATVSGLSELSSLKVGVEL